MKMTLNKRHQSGFSLLELLLVVAVGAVLILAGLGAYRLVSENNNTNQATRLLTTLKQQVQQAYQGQTSYGNAASIIDDLISMRALPSDLGVDPAGSNTVAKGPFGDVTIVGDGNTFEIGFTNVPKGACVRLAQQFTPQNANDFVSLSIASTSYTQSSTDMTQATFLTTCAEQTDTNDMVWTFQ